MSNYSKIYWFTRLDSINSIFIALGVIGIIILLLYCISYVVNKVEDFDTINEVPFVKSYGKYRNMSIWFISVGFTISTLIPTNKEALLIMAGGKTLDYVQSDTSLSKIPYQTTSIISTFLEKQLKEMKSTDK